MGELARMPGSPTLPESPMELITPRPGFSEGYSKISKLKWPVSGFAVGFISMILINRLMKRPLWSGIPLMLLVSGGVSYGCVIARDIKYAAKNESDALIKHYISLHPDDFPPYERKRYRDVYEPFFPYR